MTIFFFWNFSHSESSAAAQKVRSRTEAAHGQTATESFLKHPTESFAPPIGKHPLPHFNLKSQKSPSNVQEMHSSSSGSDRDQAEVARTTSQSFASKPALDAVRRAPDYLRHLQVRSQQQPPKPSQNEQALSFSHTTTEKANSATARTTKIPSSLMDPNKDWQTPPKLSRHNKKSLQKNGLPVPMKMTQLSNYGSTRNLTDVIRGRHMESNSIDHDSRRRKSDLRTRNPNDVTVRKSFYHK